MNILTQSQKEVNGGIEMYIYNEFIIVPPHHDINEYVVILEDEYADADLSVEQYFNTIEEVSNYILNK